MGVNKENEGWFELEEEVKPAEVNSEEESKEDPDGK